MLNTCIFELNNIDVKLNSEEKTLSLLCSLSESWDHFVTLPSFSFNTIETLEFDVVVGALLSEEVRRKSSVETSMWAIMVARGFSRERGDKSRGSSK